MIHWDTQYFSITPVKFAVFDHEGKDLANKLSKATRDKIENELHAKMIEYWKGLDSFSKSMVYGKDSLKVRAWLSRNRKELFR